MGCVSSNLLNQDDEFTQLGGSALSHHIVSLTSTTYGLLNLDPPSPHPTTTASAATTPPTQPPRFTLGSIFPTPLSEPKRLPSEPEVINSWELMSGLDTDSSFRFSSKQLSKENSNPNFIVKPLHLSFPRASKNVNVLDKFERLSPPNGEDKVVVYTTTLRGIRKTFEACNAIKSVLESFGVVICERDVSMDRGFREELRALMKNKEREGMMVPPRVFVKGRYVGGAEEVLKIVEEGWFGELIEGIPKRKVNGLCEGCGDVRFLPCFACNGSCKIAMNAKDDDEEMGQKQGRSVVVRCPDCNENGLVLCPICS